jgi:hypothetical protein
MAGSRIPLLIGATGGPTRTSITFTSILTTNFCKFQKELPGNWRYIYKSEGLHAVAGTDYFHIT